MFFVKHADQKEHPAGVLNLAYATDLVKDGTLAFSVKLSGHKHAFEAQNAPERDGWFVAVEKAITEAKASKDTIESSEGYKEHKDKISKSPDLFVSIHFVFTTRDACWLVPNRARFAAGR